MSLLGLRSAKKKKGADQAAAPAPAAKPAPTPKKGGVVVEKPPANIYTAMLIVSLVAVIIGCVCLYAEMNAYEFKMGPR